MTRRRLLRHGGALGAALLAGSQASATGRTPPNLSSSSTRGRVVESAQRLGAPITASGWRLGEIGRSVEDRPIERWDARPDHLPRAEQRRVIVVCGIHGDERAQLDFAEQFGRVAVPDDLFLTIVPLLNPDGWAAETRNNANDIDLNRNFPWNFFDPDGGIEPNSEPETQAITSYITAERPDLTVWVHQPLAYTVSLPNTPHWWSASWAETVGLDHRRGGVQVGGGGESWSANVIGCRSILIEGRDDANAEEAAAHGKALEQLLPHVVSIS